MPSVEALGKLSGCCGPIPDPGESIDDPPTRPDNQPSVITVEIES